MSELHFPTADALLCWWFATRGNEGPKAMDPAKDTIRCRDTGAREENAYWSHAVRALLREVEAAQGNQLGLLLLWLHLRPRAVVGYRDRKGVRVPIVDECVPMWSLYEHPTVAAYNYGGQRKCVALYRSTLALVERLATDKGYLTRRVRYG